MDIEPTYIKKTPTKDGWSGVMQYECADGSEYTIQSYAKGNANDGLDRDRRPDADVRRRHLLQQRRVHPVAGRSAALT